MLFFSRQYLKSLPFFYSTVRLSPFPKVSKFGPKNIISEEQYSSYYEHKLVHASNEVREIIDEMVNPLYNQRKCMGMIDKYLDEHSGKAQPPGLLLLLTVMQKIEDNNFKENCTNMIVTYILRHAKKKEFICDEKNFLLVLNAILQRYNSKFQKIQKSFIKYRYAELVKINKNCINVEKDENCILKDIINHILILRDESLVSEPIRFVSLAMIIEEKATQYIENVILKEEIGKKILRHSMFVKNLAQFYEKFPPHHTKSVQQLYKVVVRCIFSIKGRFIRTFLMLIYVYFPYLGQTENGVYYRDLVLREVENATPAQKENTLENVGKWKLFKKDLAKEAKSSQQEDPKINQAKWQEGYFLYSILAFQFYKFMNQIQFRYHQDFNYLLKQDLKTPDLPPFFWKVYYQNPQFYNSKGAIFNHILKQIYSKQYINTNPSITVVKPNAASENEIKLRVSMALDKLNIAVQAEKLLCGRYVDFVLEQDLILQVDGDYHFNLYKMDYDMMTQFRNLHLLLSGYRVILINIFEYNQNRFADQLSELIQKKINFMKESGAVLVI